MSVLHRTNLLVLQRLQLQDAVALATFYNGLSEASIRTFRPLGTQTTVEICEHMASRNLGADENYDLVAWINGRIVGWCFIWNLSEEKPTFGLSVADAFHGQGVGSRLMDSVIVEARHRKLAKVYLTVVKDNDIAWKMYARRGFVQYDEKRSHDDGLVYRHMVLPIESKDDL